MADKPPSHPYVFCYTGGQTYCTHSRCQSKTAMVLKTSEERLSAGDKSLAEKLLEVHNDIEHETLTAEDARWVVDTATKLANDVARLQCDLELMSEIRSEGFAVEVQVEIEKLARSDALDMLKYATEDVNQPCRTCPDGKYTVTEQGVECSHCAGVPLGNPLPGGAR